MAFQLLSLEQRTVVVDTFESRMHDEAHAGGFFAMIQPLEEFECELTGLHSLYAFIVEDALKIDILRVLGTDNDSRHQVLSWQTGISQVEGCVLLHNSSPAKPALPLGSPQIPVLCLIDALLEQA